MNTSYLEQSDGHDFDSIEWQTASNDSISLGSIEEEAEIFRRSEGSAKGLGKKNHDKQDQIGKTSTFKYPKSSKSSFSMKSRSRTSSKIDPAPKKQSGEIAVKSQYQTNSTPSMAAPPKADIVELKPQGPSRRALHRIPSTISFDVGCFEYLDELDTGTLSSTPPSLQYRSIKKLSGAYEEIPKADGKSKSREPPRSTSELSEFNKALAACSNFGDGLEIPETIEKAKKRKKSKKQTRKEGDRDKSKSKKKDKRHDSLVMEELGSGFDDSLVEPGSPLASKHRQLGDHIKPTFKGKTCESLSRYSDSPTEPSAQTWSDIKSITKSAAKSESSKLKAKMRDQKKEEEHLTRETKKAKSFSRLMLPKPREHPKRSAGSLRRFIEDGKEESVRKAQTVPGNFSITDTTSTARSAFSSEFVAKSLNGSAPDLNRKERSKRHKMRTGMKSSEFSHQWEEFTKKAAQENWTSTTPRPVDTKNKPVYRLRRRSSARSIRAIKTKVDSYVAGDKQSKTDALETELANIKAMIDRRKGCNSRTDMVGLFGDLSVELDSSGDVSESENKVAWNTRPDWGREGASIQFLKADWKSYLGENDPKNKTEHLHRQLDAIKDLRSAQRLQSNQELDALKAVLAEKKQKK